MTQFGDIQNNAVAYQLFKPQAITTTTTSTYVDMGEGGGGQFGTTMEVQRGAVTGTSPTLDVKLTECDTTNGTYSDMSGATFAQLTTSGADGDALGIKTVFTRSKRYVKAVATTGGTNPSFTVSLTIKEQKRVV